MPGRRRRWTDRDLRRATAAAYSIAGVLRALGLRPAGGNYQTTPRFVRRFGLDVSHWPGKAHLRGKACLHRPKRPLALLLRHGSAYHSNKLRRRLISEGVFLPRCASCGLEQWLGKAIPLELDHIDGDRENNELPNLRIV